DMLTCMFLHAGFLHLFGNMLFLWIYGDNVEHRLGSVRYLCWYLGTGIAATLFHMLGAPGSQLPLVGASGAIPGILGFYFVWFPRTRVRLLWLLPPFVMQVFEVPARIVLGIYLVLDNLLPYLIVSGDAGVAHGAHIGGFLAGLAAAWVMGRRQVGVRAEDFADGPTVTLSEEDQWTRSSQRRGTHGGGRGGVLRGAGQRQPRAPHAGALTRARALAARASPLRGRAGRGPTAHARLPGRPGPRGGASACRTGPARGPAAHARVPALPGRARHRLGSGAGPPRAGPDRPHPPPAHPPH